MVAVVDPDQQSRGTRNQRWQVDTSSGSGGGIRTQIAPLVHIRKKVADSMGVPEECAALSALCR